MQCRLGTVMDREKGSVVLQLSADAINQLMRGVCNETFPGTPPPKRFSVLSKTVTHENAGSAAPQLFGAVIFFII